MAKEKPVLIAKSRDRMPNHLFYATVRHFDKKNAVARKALCELYLPDSHRGEIEIIFHPTVEQIPAFKFFPPFRCMPGRGLDVSCSDRTKFGTKGRRPGCKMAFHLCTLARGAPRILRSTTYLGSRKATL